MAIRAPEAGAADSSSGSAGSVAFFFALSAMAAASRFLAPSVSTPISRRSASDRRARRAKVTLRRTIAEANAGGLSTACAQAATSCHSPSPPSCHKKALTGSTSGSTPPPRRGPPSRAPSRVSTGITPSIAPSRHALTCATRASAVSATSARRRKHTGHTGHSSGGSASRDAASDAGCPVFLFASPSGASSSSSWYSSATDSGTAWSSSSSS
mmetsp:Transcript_11321/g.47475  ORF Transcript_11321/g.47475 Transcript_11321/m.47475 type:complete len:212 (+) Transcript_11321:1800-2435(+)